MTNKTNTTISRNTKHKQAIQHCLSSNISCHMTAEDIITWLKSKSYSIGQASVYRILRNFEQSGIVKKYVAANQQGFCYQYLAPNSSCHQHYHLICEKCDHILHIESSNLDKFIQEMAELRHFKLDLERLFFYGHCNNCNT